LNYYSYQPINEKLLRLEDLMSASGYPPGSDLSEHDFIANHPQGMFQGLKWGLKYNLPILIAENGVEDSADRMRPRYLLEHVHQAWRAVNFNFPVMGYLHWTLVDNFEWERGWTQRFGLWELNIETQARRKRPSADLYAEICRENGISSEMTALYAPEIFDKLFPG
jgi:beta-glucosidase